MAGEDATGLAGVTVSARHMDLDVEESAITDIGGRYRLQVEFPGEVEVVAWRFGFRQERKGGVRPGGAENPLNFVLKKETDERRIIETLPNSSFMTLLPEGWVKRDHILEWGGFASAVLQQSSVEELTNRLRVGVHARNRGSISFGTVSVSPTESYVRPEAMARWMAQYAPLGKELKNFRLPALSTPDSANIQITEFFMPKGGSTHDIYLAPDGIVWANQKPEGLYRLDSKTGKGRTVPFPWANRNIVPIRDSSHFWVTTYMGRIVEFDPKTEKMTGKVFDLAKELGAYFPHTARTDVDGNLWVGDYLGQYPGRAVKIDVGTGKITLIEFPALPLPFDRKATQAYGLCMCPDGRIWATLLVADTLLEIDPRTLKVRARELPEIHGGPRRLDCDRDGILWIPAFAAGALFRFDPKTEEFRKYSSPTQDAGLYTVKVHPKTGDVWIVTQFSSQIYRFDPQKAQFSVYQMPDRQHYAKDIQFAGDREVWAAQDGRRQQSLIRIRY